MTIFNEKDLDGVPSPQLAIAVAKRTHELALQLVEEGKISKYFLDREIYKWGEEETLPNGVSYNEISQYSDGFGGSLFIRGEEMLILGSDHETAALNAIDGDRDLYLTPLVRGLPRTWDFVVDMLQIQPRFELNPPVSVLWFKDGVWNITDDYEEIKSSSRDSRLGDYKDSVDFIPVGELNAIFAHGGLDEVSDEVILDSYLNEWINFG
jgi:hypothetical protein